MGRTSLISACSRVVDQCLHAEIGNHEEEEKSELDDGRSTVADPCSSTHMLAYAYHTAVSFHSCHTPDHARTSVADLSWHIASQVSEAEFSSCHIVLHQVCSKDASLAVVKSLHEALA